jgi:putative ABC transport system permease protein
VGNLWRDIQFGLRMLARNKGFSAIAILVLALGIGPNVAIFSIVYATFLAPMPYPDADQLVVIWNMTKGERESMAADEYLQFLAESKSFSNLSFGSYSISPAITGPDHIAEEIGGMAVTPDAYTKSLKLPMAMGRDFLPSELVPGNDHVIVITHKLWESRYHRDPEFIGKSINVNDQPYTVVGVVAAGMGDRIPMEFLVPAALNPPGHNPHHWGGASGRLKPGVTIAQAQAELSLIDRRFVAAQAGKLHRGPWTISVEPLHNAFLDKKLGRNLWLLLAAVGFVLLIACANLANLLLARGSSRQQEIAVRSAMGASRRRVFAQLITESLALAIAGGTAGIALGWAMMKIAMTQLPDFGLESEALVALNLPVLFFAVTATLVAGVISGCVPAWQAARLNLSETLKQGSRSVSGGRRKHTQAVLVMAEFALALTLLAGAAMTLHSFWNLTHIDLGVRTDHILTGNLQPPKTDLRHSEQIIAEARNLLAKINSQPGVKSVALASNMPLHGHDSYPFSIAGEPVNDKNMPVADLEIMTPSYFNTFGVQLIKGRLFDDNDRIGSSQVIMVSQSFVDRYLSGTNPLDQRLMMRLAEPGDKLATPTPWQIVGVFHGIRNGEHLNEETTPQIFVPYWQLPIPDMGLAVRTAGDPALVTHGVRAALAATLAGYRLDDVSTMQQSVDSELVSDRFGSALFGAFAALALLLAALGIYGVMAFAVAQRNHEIGLRMALGAQRQDIVWLVLTDALKLALTGTGVGLVGVVILGRVMHSTLYGVNAIDSASFAIVAALLLAVAIIASYLPARRSAKVDPMVALRSE